MSADPTISVRMRRYRARQREDCYFTRLDMPAVLLRRLLDCEYLSMQAVDDPVARGMALLTFLRAHRFL